MTNAEYRIKNQEEYIESPYKNLYIYYLEGQFKPDKKLFGNGFIGNWQEDEFAFLFFSKPSRREVENMLSAHSSLTLIDEFYMTYDQWQGGKSAPFKIGRFRIVPPWQRPSEKINAAPEELTIVLDPGVVFGAGTHTTTHDCLKALELAFNRERVESVLDLGTGTGLLALAASRVGCKSALAVDLNLLAANTALKNVRLNHLEDLILVVQGRAEDFIDSSSDLVIANIHYDVMQHLITSQGFLSKKWFILSGLMRSQARDLVYKLSWQPVQILKKWEHDGIWHTFFGKIC